MKKLSLFFTLALLGVAFSFQTSRAQDAESPDMFLVMEEFVAPSDMAEFWKVQSEGFELMDKLDFKLHFGAFQTDRNSFYWVFPIKSFADIDASYAQWMDYARQMKESGWDPQQKFRGLSNMSQFVVKFDKDLSRIAPKVENAEPQIFYEWTYVYLKSGHEEEAGEVIQKFKQFYDEEGIEFYWYVYPVMLGEHTPCWILETIADNEADFRKLESEIHKKYKEDTRPMWQEFVQHVRSIDTVKGWYLPDWSRWGNE